jgi:transposase
VGHVGRLIALAVDPTTDIPDQARPILAIIAESIQALQAKITLLDREIAARARADPVAKRLMTIPGVEPVVATALVALAPPAGAFRRGGDFAAWVGLTPRQNSSGGKERLGRISKMGERNLRRLIILGAGGGRRSPRRDIRRRPLRDCFPHHARVAAVKAAILKLLNPPT